MAGQDNSFSLLFSSPEAAKRQRDAVERQKREITETLNRIFLISLTKSAESGGNVPKYVAILPQLAKDEERMGRKGALDMENLMQALAERLQMTNPSSTVICRDTGIDKGHISRKHAVEQSKISYLAYCFIRAHLESVHSRLNPAVRVVMIEKCKSSIIEMTSPVLQLGQSVLAPGQIQDTTDTFTDLLMSCVQEDPGNPILVEFFVRIANSLAVTSELIKAAVIFEPALTNMFHKIQNLNFGSPLIPQCFSLLDLYSTHTILAQVLVLSKHWLPRDKIGKSFETSTLIGRLLSLSPISQSPMHPSPLFNPEDMQHRHNVEGMTDLARTQTQFITFRMHKVFDKLLRVSPEARKSLIDWVARCLEQNQDRGKMMSRLESAHRMPVSHLCASDGFFLNLSWVMLKLAAPFVNLVGQRSRLSSINPVYCWVSKAQITNLDKGGMVLDFSDDARLVPFSDSDNAQPFSMTSHVPFNFITHCFFLTHKSLLLGMTQVLHRYDDLMNAYSQAHDVLLSVSQSGGMGNPLFNQAQSQFKMLHMQVLGVKAHVMDPQLLDLCLSFYSTTAHWLVRLASSGSYDPCDTSHDPSVASHDTSVASHDTSAASTVKSVVSHDTSVVSHDTSVVSHDTSVASCEVSTLFPLPNEAPPELRIIPEFLIDNMAHFFSFLKRSQADILNSVPHRLNPFITFVTVFMGSPQLVRNPHTRATVSHLLHAMIPETEDGGLVPDESQSRLAVFESHPLANQHLIQALMSIFVDIEFTGDSMEFEAKFQYRIPMYDILNFLWLLPSYLPSIESLNLEAVQFDGAAPGAAAQELPILLRFINMMINDATVQLDEGLESLVRIKEVQTIMESEQWKSLSAAEKNEYQQKLSEDTYMAKNRNLLAEFTVQAIELVTRVDPEPFLLPTIVSRMVAMLNYVLKEIVGPKRKELSVKDMSKFNFNPKQLICRIVEIFINLGQCDEFCEALPRDGRSFSIPILEETVAILRTLRRLELMVNMEELIRKVRECQDNMEREEMAFDDAPDEFLDPLTNEIMLEPVTLPTSGVTMDKANVIRHLLSDQTDPFNRAPLTADMMQSNDELKQKIEDWKRKKLEELNLKK